MLLWANLCAMTQNLSSQVPQYTLQENKPSTWTTGNEESCYFQFRKSRNPPKCLVLFF